MTTNAINDAIVVVSIVVSSDSKQKPITVVNVGVGILCTRHR
jgi:hypothetical protein